MRKFPRTGHGATCIYGPNPVLGSPRCSLSWIPLVMRRRHGLPHAGVWEDEYWPLLLFHLFEVCGSSCFAQVFVTSPWLYYVSCELNPVWSCMCSACSPTHTPLPPCPRVTKRLDGASLFQVLGPCFGARECFSLHVTSRRVPQLKATVSAVPGVLRVFYWSDVVTVATLAHSLYYVCDVPLRTVYSEAPLCVLYYASK